MTTIFIAAPQGFATRYLLKSGLVESLLAAAPDLRIVALVRPDLVADLQRDVGGERLLVRPLRFDEIRQRHARTLIGPRLTQIRQCVLDPRLHHASADYWLRLFLERYRALGPLHGLSQFYLRGAVAALRRSPRLRRAMRRLEARLLPSRFHDELYDEFGPSLLVVGSLGFFEVDSYLVREARARGVPSVGIVTNWDHTVSKGTSGALPDHGIVWGTKMREECVVHHDMPEERLAIAGAVHYDLYRDPGTFVSRVAFCAERGLDPRRRTILYAGMSPRPYPWNPEVIETLARACAEDRFGVPAQLLVRLHPTHLQLATERPEQWAREEARYEELRRRFPHLVIEQPRGSGGARGQFELERHDAAVLANSLFHADVVVCFFSTLNLEAALLDRPTVNCYVYEWRSGDRERQSILDLTHLQGVFATRSSRIAHSDEELIAQVAAYLADPGLDRPARRRLAESECGAAAETAVARATRQILALLPGREAPAVPPSEAAAA